MNVQEKTNDNKYTFTIDSKIPFDNKGGEVLGILEGPVADFMHPTRNGRMYFEKLWDNVEQDKEVQEMFKNGGIPGELDHPEDRDYICSEKIAVLLREPPKKDKKTGKLVARFDIVNTPCGKIVYTLAKAGFKFGVSSRGTGDTYYDDAYTEDGTQEVEIVDEDTYKFKCFDLVLMPAVEGARLSLISEGVSTNYKKELKEIYSKSSQMDKKLISETLDHLGINIKSGQKEKKAKLESEEPTNESELKEPLVNDKKGDSNELENSPKEAEDNGLTEIFQSLQDTLKTKATLETKILELQEKLAVSDTKVNQLNEELARYKMATATLSISAKELKRVKSDFKTLEEKLSNSELLVSKQKEKIKELTEAKKINVDKTKIIHEKFSNSQEKVTSLKESLDLLKVELNDKTKNSKALSEKLRLAEEENANLKEMLNKKLTTSKKIVENYKKICNDTVSHYIKLRARLLGVTPNEITNRLNDSYTLKDVDNICESMQNYNLNISKLPFSVDKKTRGEVKVGIVSKNEPKLNSTDDDFIDESLLKMANML